MDDILTLADGTRTDVLASLALMGWGIGHMFTGARMSEDWSKTPSTKPLEKAGKWAVKQLNRSNPMTNARLYGMADIASVASNPKGIEPIGMGAALLGFTKALLNEKINMRFKNTPLEIWNHHITPFRLMAAGYMVAAANSGDSSYAIAILCAATGLILFDPSQNNDLMRRIGLKKETPKPPELEG